MIEHAEEAKGWLLPISEAEPAGKDSRHEAEHEVVRAEIGKLSAITGARVDWAQIELQASALITRKSKDLVIATYLACALQELRGLAGLDVGLSLLAGLAETFGDAIFPVRARARINALEWFVDRAALRLETAEGSLPEVAGVKQRLAALNSSLRAWLGNESVSFSRLEVALDRMALSAKAPVPDAATAAQNAPTPSASTEDQGADGAGLALLDVTRWLHPISAEEPAGSDTSYGEAATQVRDELAKLEALAGGKPNWQRVFDECDRLLRSETKDFVLATQLTLALYALHGFEGLSVGLSLVARLSEEYWEGMWPPLTRLRRRTNALSSLIERLTVSLSNTRPTEADLPALSRLDEVVNVLAGTSERRFGGDAPALTPLRSTLQRLREAALLAPTPASEPTPASAPPSVTASPSADIPRARPATPEPALPTLSPTPADAGQVGAFLENTSAALIEVASVLRSANTASPLACRLLRTGVWLEIESLPGADAEGKTRIAPPDRRVRAALAGYVAAENWTAALAQAEGMFPSDLFWLDLQFYAARAHAGLGPAHQRAAIVIQGETQKLVRRLPGLTALRFSDGSPLASAETMAWLEPTPQVAVTRAASATESTDPPLPDELKEAILRSEPGAAASLDALLAAASVRTSFHIRLELAMACLTKGALDSGIALLLGLEGELDSYQLERWEPELAQQVVKTLWSALQTHRGTTGVVHPEAARVCARLARLLPSALL